jgi:hypothetical protein
VEAVNEEQHGRPPHRLRLRAQIRRLTAAELAWQQAVYVFEHFDGDGRPPWPASEDETAEDDPG